MPLSAAFLVIGAAAVALGAALAPQTLSTWGALAAVCLLLGLPAVVVLDGGTRLGVLGAAVLALGCLALAAYAVALGVMPQLGLVGGAGPPRMITAWVLVVGLGELLLALALFRGRRVARWVPAVLVVHVCLLPTLTQVPGLLPTTGAVLLTLAFAGLGVAANQSRVPAAGGGVTPTSR